MKRRKTKKSALIIACLLCILVIVPVLATLYYNNTYLPKKYPLHYSEYIEKYAAEYNVPPYLVYAVVYSESGFRQDARSGAGAMGLMQLLPSTFEWLCKYHLKGDYTEEDILNPDINIRYGVFYLSYLYNLLESWDNTIAAYNAGDYAVKSWLADSRYSKDGKTLTNIPYPETENYLKKVNKIKEAYEKIYGT